MILRLAGLLGALFVIGTGIGLAAASAVPVAAQSPPGPQLAAAGATTVDAVEAATAPPQDACVAAPLRERAAQTLVVGLPDATTIDAPIVDEVLELGVGGVFINDGNVVTAEQIAELVTGLRAAAPHGLFVTTDEEAGRVSTFRHVVGATSSPRTLAATRTAEEVRTYARELGAQLAALGLSSDLAPVADLDDGPAYGVIGDRSFSADPLVAAEYAEAFATGLSEAGLVPVAKHFPGLGGAPDDVHRRATRVTASLEDLLGTDVLPFIGLIEAGVPAVMVGHARYDALDPALPASLSAASYALLRDLGFAGVAMTDSVGMGAVHRRWDFPEAAVRALQAGADAVLATDGRHAGAMVDAIVAAVEAGDLPEPRLDEAAARMLALKDVDPATLTCTDVTGFPRMGDIDTVLR